MLKIDAETATRLRGQHQHWAYNALDCTGTLEVWENLAERLDPVVRRYYYFNMALQNPAIDMMIRGCAIDGVKMKKALRDLEKDLRHAAKDTSKVDVVRASWDGVEKETGTCKKATRKDGKHKWEKWEKGKVETGRLCVDCGKPRLAPQLFNPQSSHQCRKLLYDILGVPARRGKTGSVTTDDEAILSIKAKFKELTDLCDAILAVRNIKKQIGFMKSKLSGDGRWRQSVNVGAAWTGRFSSSKNPFNEGNNMANVGERHRYIFVADPGYEIFYCDKKTAESNFVAHLSGDEGYIEAHNSKDVHTLVCRAVWPDLPWTGDDDKDIKVAKSHYPEWDNVEGHDFRFQAKRIQHGSNYGLTYHGISRIAKIPLPAAKAAWETYHAKFPGIQAWQKHLRSRVSDGLSLTNPLGFRASLFGRPWDDHTHKQGFAFQPQSGVAMLLNISMWLVWKHHPEVQLFANVYDAILGQYPKEEREHWHKMILQEMDLSLAVTDINGITRGMFIGNDVAYGSNWGKRSEDNPGGMI